MFPHLLGLCREEDIFILFKRSNMKKIESKCQDLDSHDFLNIDFNDIES